MPPPVRYLDVCSGLSAPTVAWAPRGWEALAYAEIDPFASAVLASRFGAGRPRYMPDPAETLDPEEAAKRRNAIKALDKIEWGSRTPNEGDFTRLRDEPLIADADVLVGGTPCQAFSLAGLRGSLSDHRGNLTLEFIRLANAIDDLRLADGRGPAVVLWENVPGVLSTKDNAFGAFLAGMVGGQSPLDCSRHGGWPDAGVVAGPRRVAAWRTLDAQHFGLAQRRRRVFVLASGYPRGWAVADALLPLIDSMRGHPAPSRQARSGVARGVGASTGGPSAKEQQLTFVRGDGEPLNDLDRGELVAGPGGRDVAAYGGNRQSGPLDVATARLAHGGPHGHMDFETETFVVEPPEIAPALTGRPYRDGGADDSGLVCFDPTQITHRENRSNPKPGDPAPTLSQSGYPPAIAYQEVAAPLLAGSDGAGPRSTDAESGTFVAVNFEHGLAPHGSMALRDVADEIGAAEAKGHTAVIAFTAKDHGQDVGDDIAPTLRAMEGRHANAGGQIAVAFSMRGRDGENMIEPEAGDVAPAIRTGDGGSSKPFVAIHAFNLSPGAGSDGAPSATEGDVANAITGEYAEQNGRGAHIVQAFKPSHYTRDKDGAPSDISPPLSADADKGDQDAVLFIQREEAAAFTIAKGSNGYAWESDVAPALMTQSPNPSQNLFSGVRTSSAVRRLTPVECEFLQGFPKNFTLIPYSDARRSEEDMAETLAYLLAAGFSGNEARVLADTPDGPRYRGLGNSMATDVIAELGARIAWVLEQ